MSSTIAEQLRTLLDRDAETTGIVTSRNGLINRKHYARLIGITPSGLGQTYKRILSSYEDRHKIATGPIAKLNEMRAWLERAYSTGDLVIRDGRVDRLACMQDFAIKGGAVFSRHPEIRALFEEFDRRVAEGDYLPADRRAELEKIKAWLVSPELNRDRLTINRRRLTAAVGIEVIRLRDHHIAEAIAVAEAKILGKAQQSQMDPYLHGRVFPFSALAKLWPRAFLERVGARFKIAMSGSAADSAKQTYLALFAALECIGQSKDQTCRAVVADAKANGRVLNGDPWEEAIYKLREHLIGRSEQGAVAKTRLNRQIKVLRTSLDVLESGHVVPKLSALLPGVKLARRRGGGHSKSLAEALPTPSSSSIDSYVQFARTQLENACRLSGSDSDKAESQGFIRGIADELIRHAGLPQSPSEAVLAILDKRLSVLRDRAAAIVETARTKHDQGRRLLALADIDPPAFENRYLGDELNHYEKGLLVREFFPYPVKNTEGARDRTIANLLKLIGDRFKASPPSANAPVQGYGQFFQKRYLELGGLGHLEGFLLPSADACGAVLTLYLCEGGANVGVGRTLDRNCVEESDLAGYSRVTGHKARAAGKPIYVDLPRENAAVQALLWLKKATEPLAAAADDNSDRLFLMRIGSRVQLMTQHWYTSWFKKFASAIPAMEGLSLVPSMLRPSVLLQAALTNDGRLQVGRAIGQHAPAVAQGYQQKWPTRLLYDEQIRRFQTDLETLIVQSIPDAARRLGLTPEEMQMRLAKVRPTGLGTFCLNLQPMSDRKDARCNTMRCWDDCPHLLIIAEVEAIATLQLWQASLRAAAPDWERDRAERWEKVWLPWLCLSDVVEEKMTRGPLIKVWKAAQRRANQLRNSSDFVAHRPW